MAATNDELEALHQFAKNWTREAVADMKTTARAMGVQGTSVDAMRGNVKIWSDTKLLRSVVFTATRALIFTQRGVGQGTKKADIGRTKRKAKPFMAEVFDRRVEVLADAIGQKVAGTVVNAVTFLK